ncbi:MAG TPA: antibiotic biosynthesis monooxygenase family protein [Nitrososphaeraceae archaeon]|nr:antibiotic biosynthesis monooxygenase family protein [Nitrososphaeraceae archaeon]
MVKLVEMDEKITLYMQMKEKNISPVILINKFNVKSEDVDGFPRAWAAEAEIMKRQSGFISTQLHRGIAGSCVFINYAVWESTEHYKRAVNNPEFQSVLAKHPASTMASPHLFKKVAVPGICVE